MSACHDFKQTQSINRGTLYHTLFFIPQVFKDFEFKDRMFTSIADLVTLSVFLGVSPPVREAVAAAARGDRVRDVSAFKAYLKQAS